MKYPECEIGELCLVRRGTTITKEQTRSGTIPVVAGGLQPTYFHDEANRAGNIVTVSGSGANAGHVAFWPGPIFASDCSTVESKRDDVCIDYIFRALQAKQTFINSKLRSGAAQPHVYAKDIAKIRIPFPPQSEQRRIAALLDIGDALRCKRRAALAQLDSLAKSLFVEMFGDPKTNPKSWTVQPLGELTRKITDGEHLNPVFAPTGMPIVMAGNVSEDIIDLVSAKKVALSLGEKFRRKCNPEEGDLLVVSRGATIGRMCAVSTSEQFCLMGSVILIKLDSSLLATGFIAAMLKHPKTRALLYQTSGSSAQQAIYLKDLKNLPCIVPPIEIQRRFEVRASAIERIAAVHRIAVRKSDDLFLSLQDRAFQRPSCEQQIIGSGTSSHGLSAGHHGQTGSATPESQCVPVDEAVSSTDE